MPEINRIISEARRIIDYRPEDICFSIRRRFGDYYVRVGAYRVYFHINEQTGLLIEGSERVVRVYGWTCRSAVSAFGRAVSQGLVCSCLVLLIIAGFALDVLGVRSLLFSEIPETIMSIVLNVPKLQIKDNGNGLYRLDGYRITAGDNNHEPLSVYYNPRRWLIDDPRAVRIVRQRIGSDGRDYGSENLLLEHKDDRLFLDKEGMSLEMIRDGNLIRYRNDSWLGNGDDVGISSDVERLNIVTGEEVSIKNGVVVVRDIE